MLPYLNNIGDYFAANYVAEGFAKEALDKAGYDKETQEGYRKDLLRLRKVYFDYRTDYQRAGNRRRKDLIKRTHEWHNALLSALGYDVRATPYEFVDTKRDGVVPIRKIYRGADGAPQLFLMEMRSELRRGEEPAEGLFEQQYHRQSWEPVFTVPEGMELTPSIVNRAVSAVFLLDERERPDYILLPAGNKIYLLHYEKWSRGSYLEIDLETMFETGRDKKNKAYYPAFHALLSRTSLAPDGSLAVVDQLNQESHKKAQAVTRDLKDGVVLAVELLANEALGERRMTNDEKRMTNELPRGSSSLGSSHNTASSVPPSLHPRPRPLTPKNSLPTA